MAFYAIWILEGRLTRCRQPGEKVCDVTEVRFHGRF
jgi:hypothetical protein